MRLARESGESTKSERREMRWEVRSEGEERGWNCMLIALICSPPLLERSGLKGLLSVWSFHKKKSTLAPEELTGQGLHWRRREERERERSWRIEPVSEQNSTAAAAAKPVTRVQVTDESWSEDVLFERKEKADDLCSSCCLTWLALCVWFVHSFEVWLISPKFTLRASRCPKKGPATCHSHKEKGSERESESEKEKKRDQCHSLTSSLDTKDVWGEKNR